MGFFSPLFRTKPRCTWFFKAEFTDLFYCIFIQVFFFYYAHLDGRTAQAYAYLYSLLLRTHLQLSQGTMLLLLHFLWESLKSLLPPNSISSESFRETRVPRSNHRAPEAWGGAHGISLELSVDNLYLPSVWGEFCSAFPVCSFLFEYRPRRF